MLIRKVFVLCSVKNGKHNKWEQSCGRFILMYVHMYGTKEEGSVPLPGRTKSMGVRAKKVLEIGAFFQVRWISNSKVLVLELKEYT